MVIPRSGAPRARLSDDREMLFELKEGATQPGYRSILISQSNCEEIFHRTAGFHLAEDEGPPKKLNEEGVKYRAKPDMFEFDAKTAAGKDSGLPALRSSISDKRSSGYTSSPLRGPSAGASPMRGTTGVGPAAVTEPRVFAPYAAFEAFGDMMLSDVGLAPKTTVTRLTLYGSDVWDVFIVNTEKCEGERLAPFSEADVREGKVRFQLTCLLCARLFGVNDFHIGNVMLQLEPYTMWIIDSMPWPFVFNLDYLCEPLARDDHMATCFDWADGRTAIELPGFKDKTETYACAFAALHKMTSNLMAAHRIKAREVLVRDGDRFTAVWSEAIQRIADGMHLAMETTSAVQSHIGKNLKGFITKLRGSSQAIKEKRKEWTKFEHHKLDKGHAARITRLMWHSWS
jgi:hypothetical protein